MNLFEKSLFDRIVDEALRNQKDLAPLRIVVEKELLQHDILRELSQAGFLKNLVFIGGTCLRVCYGSNRLSEDLDFAGGMDFNPEKLADLSSVLKNQLQAKYGLVVMVSEPSCEPSAEKSKIPGSVDTWKLKIQTRPKQADLPMQRINIDICKIQSHDPRPMTLRNFYGVDMGTNGLILQAESREEILADKFIALALRPNRLKYRDLWDIAWLDQQGISLSLELVFLKLQDRACDPVYFLKCLNQRDQLLQEDSQENSQLVKEFKAEMQRFLPIDIISKTIDQADFWAYLINLIHEKCQQIVRHEKTRK